MLRKFSVAANKKPTEDKPAEENSKRTKTSGGEYKVVEGGSTEENTSDDKSNDENSEKFENVGGELANLATLAAWESKQMIGKDKVVENANNTEPSEGELEGTDAYSYTTTEDSKEDGEPINYSNPEVIYAILPFIALKFSTFVVLLYQNIISI